MSTRPAAHDPASVLFGQTRRRVLGLLFGHPGESFYVRDIVRRSGAAQGAITRELAALTRAGLLLRRVEGRQVYFQANKESAVYPEIERLVMKTIGLVDLLRDALAAFGARIAAALVFGSVARGELKSDSDIDLLVIGDVRFMDVVGTLATAQERVGRDVNPTVYPLSEFRKKLADGHHFVTTVLSEPHLFVIGGPDDLGRLGAQRLGRSAQKQPKRDPRSPRRRRARPRGLAGWES